METGDRKGKEVKQSCETKQSPTEGNFGFTPQWDPGDGVDLLSALSQLTGAAREM